MKVAFSSPSFVKFLQNLILPISPMSSRKFRC